MTIKPQKRALGRGLDALLPVAPSASSSPTSSTGERSVFVCAIEKLTPMKGQPRRHFEPTALEELAASIKEHGLLEPIVVRRPAPGQDHFEIIAGERRYRASQKAGLREVMVVVKEVGPDTAFELALIENVQREDLNAIELAEALGRLVEEHGHTQETLATRLGKDRSTIANSLRLLKLPVRVREKVVMGELSEGHARALLGVPTAKEMDDLADKVLRGRLSVRATEALVRKAKDRANGVKPEATAKGAEKSPAIRDLEARLTRALGIKVEVRDQGNKGELVIPYSDLDALDRILDRLM